MGVFISFQMEMYNNETTKRSMILTPWRQPSILEFQRLKNCSCLILHNTPTLEIVPNSDNMVSQIHGYLGARAKARSESKKRERSEKRNFQKLLEWERFLHNIYFYIFWCICQQNHVHPSKFKPLYTNMQSFSCI